MAEVDTAEFRDAPQSDSIALIDPYDAIFKLTKDELLTKYRRGIIERYPRAKDAAEAADVTTNSIRSWKKKLEDSTPDQEETS